jgi:Xaa-Pro aminopeptidase
MLVFCGRRDGLYANLTRFVSFREPSARELDLQHRVAAVESAAFAASRPGATVADVFHAIVARYAEVELADEWRRHHQGGTTGYLAREIVATPDTGDRLDADTALAWNPSAPGVKLEDTVLVTERGIEVMTIDPAWPTLGVDGRARPDVLVRP